MGSLFEDSVISEELDQTNYEEEEEEEKMISVKVKREEMEREMEEVCFKIEPDIPLRWLMIRYCASRPWLLMGYRVTRFVFNGSRLRETDTPRQLAMLDGDVIYACPQSDPPPTEGGNGRNGAQYVTLSIRRHKEKDVFIRVRRSATIQPQIMRYLSSEYGSPLHSLCFVYNGLELTEDHTADDLKIEDGDIIDAFDFDKSSSSLSIISSFVVLKVALATGNDGRNRQFTINRNIPLSTILNKYCELEFLSLGHGAKFVFKGRMVHPQRTAEQEQLEDGDVIYACPTLLGY